MGRRTGEFVGPGVRSRNRLHNEAAGEPDRESIYRRLFSADTAILSFAAVFATVVLLSIAGPLGTDRSFGLPGRFLYWGSCALVTWPFCYAAFAAVLYFVRSARSFEVGLVLATVGSTLQWRSPWQRRPACCRYAVAPRLFGRRIGGDLPGLRRSRSRYPVLVQRPGVFPPRDPARCRVRAGRRFRWHRHRGNGRSSTGGYDVANRAERPAAQQSRLPEKAQAGFFDRLPVRMGRDLIFLKADDHYLDVYTVAGHGLLLMRLVDAVSELGTSGPAGPPLLLGIAPAYYGFDEDRRPLLAAAVKRSPCTGEPYSHQGGTGLQPPRTVRPVIGTTEPASRPFGYDRFLDLHEWVIRISC